MEWNLIDTAPLDRDLELAFIDSEGAHSLSFPCRRIEGGWVEVETDERFTYALHTGGIGQLVNAVPVF